MPSPGGASLGAHWERLRSSGPGVILTHPGGGAGLTQTRLLVGTTGCGGLAASQRRTPPSPVACEHGGAPEVRAHRQQRIPAVRGEAAAHDAGVRHRTGGSVQPVRAVAVAPTCTSDGATPASAGDDRSPVFWTRALPARVRRRSPPQPVSQARPHRAQRTDKLSSPGEDDFEVLAGPVRSGEVEDCHLVDLRTRVLALALDKGGRPFSRLDASSDVEDPASVQWSLRDDACSDGISRSHGRRGWGVRSSVLAPLQAPRG